MKKILTSTAKIRFHDCDPFNHLNNSRYLDYFMTARGDQLIDHYNLDIYKLAQQESIGWVSAQTQISYLVPAYVMEEVLIETQLLAFTEKTLMLEAAMWNLDKSKLKSLMWTRLVHFNLKTARSHIHNTELMTFFSQIQNPLVSSVLFEERVQALAAIPKTNPV